MSTPQCMCKHICSELTMKVLRKTNLGLKDLTPNITLRRMGNYHVRFNNLMYGYKHTFPLHYMDFRALTGLYAIRTDCCLKGLGSVLKER